MLTTWTLDSIKLHTDETMRMKTMVVGLIKVQEVQTHSIENEPIKRHDKSIANGCHTIGHMRHLTYAQFT